MPNSIRWTPEQFEEYQKRGKVTTHRIAKLGESKPQKSNSKYNAVKTEAEGFRFSSKKEAKRWMDLRLLEKAGEIRELKRQVEYLLAVNGVAICSYYADFVYRKGQESVVEDTKGMKTPMFMIKAKLMLALHGIVILET